MGLKTPLLTGGENDSDVCICGHTREVHTCENESVMTACEFASKCDCGEFKLKKEPLLTDEEIERRAFDCVTTSQYSYSEGGKWARDFYEKKRLVAASASADADNTERGKRGEEGKA